MWALLHGSTKEHTHNHTPTIKIFYEFKTINNCNPHF